MISSPLAIGDLVPHSGRMLLLDRLVEHDADSLTAEVTVRANHLFVSNTGVGSWVGLEYMAQAIAAWAGCAARARGESPKIGFLLGSRQYSCNTPTFPIGCTLRVTVVSQLQDDSGLGSFRGAIVGDGVSAEATVTVFQPHDVDQFLRERAS